jgi:hypothetical protein
VILLLLWILAVMWIAIEKKIGRLEAGEANVFFSLGCAQITCGQSGIAVEHNLARLYVRITRLSLLASTTIMTCPPQPQSKPDVSSPFPFTFAIHLHFFPSVVAGDCCRNQSPARSSASAVAVSVFGCCVAARQWVARVACAVS